MTDQLRNITAITFSLFVGLIVSAALPGCQPPAQETPKPSASVAPVPEEKKEEKAAEPKHPEDKLAEEKKDQPLSTPKPEVEPPAKTPEKPASQPEDKTASAKEVNLPTENPVMKTGDWTQWGGNSIRNNVPALAADAKLPVDWAPGEFDPQTNVWNKDKAKNILWVAELGSQTYGNTVVAGGKIFVGTNNGKGYLKRYPADVDLGCLIALDEKTGKFLWQHSSEKLPTGRVHDWPLMGICCSPLVEDGRVWFVTSRGEVKCLDAEGFADNEDDGPVTREPARLFDVMRADDAADDKLGPIVKELGEGKLSEDLRKRFIKAGFELPAEVALEAKDPGKTWLLKAEVGGAAREARLSLIGPRLSAFKIITPDDKDEADVVWSVDMMKQLGTSQHNMCSCSVTSWGDLLFVNSSNGVHEDHKTIPSPDAPSFICMNKNTGEIYWTDNSPRDNILHGQWSSPAVAIIAGTPQVIFGGGDGWVYSFRADLGKDGKGEMLWKFDINEKDAILELGGRGTRNDIIATPVIYDNKVYFATGQDPEHGEGRGTFWCIDPTKRGDISEYLAVDVKGGEQKILPPRRVSAIDKSNPTEKAIPNPNSGVVWKLNEQDWNNDGKLDDFMEKFHRGIGTCAIKNDLLFVADFSGLFLCINAQTGKIHWAHDMLAASWGSPLIANDKVYIGDEDGDILVFELKSEKHEPLAEINMANSVYSSPILANGVLYIANKDHLFAITAGEEK